MAHMVVLVKLKDFETGEPAVECNIFEPLNSGSLQSNVFGGVPVICDSSAFTITKYSMEKRPLGPSINEILEPTLPTDHLPFDPCGFPVFPASGRCFFNQNTAR